MIQRLLRKLFGVRSASDIERNRGEAMARGFCDGLSGAPPPVRHAPWYAPRSNWDPPWQSAELRRKARLARREARRFVRDYS